MPKTGYAVVLLVLLTTFGMTAVAWGQEYIVMGAPTVNIRTGPSTDHVIIGRAGKGDVFKLIAKDGDWLEIGMFSGVHRYVFAGSYVYELTRAQLVPGHRMTLPDSENARRSIYRGLQRARDRAEREAEEVIPASVDAQRNATFRRIMEDRIILEMMRDNGIQPALYDDLVSEGEKSNW
jgi:uncharacterized protein YgiM (DUF1202 family)